MSRRPAARSGRPSVAARLVAACGLLLGGCMTDARPAPSAYVYVIDWSGSTAKVRRQLLGAVIAELQLAPDGTRAVVYRMGSTTQEVFNDRLGPGAVDAVARALARDAVPSDPRRGTSFPAMAAALREFSRAYTGGPYAVRVMTDGGDDLAGDREAAASYRRDAAFVCADQRLVEVAFYGVEAGYKEAIRGAFGGARRLRFPDAGRLDE